MYPFTDPGALADQIDAATRDARTHLTQLAHYLAAPITHTTTPPWLDGHLSALRDGLRDGRVRSCAHLAVGPGIAYTAVWAPRLIACPACAPTLLRPSPIEDDTCDRCRTTAPRLHIGAVATGPILLAYGLCRRCQRTHTATPPQCSSSRSNRRLRRCRRGRP